MVEVLVAIVVLSIGLLGTATLYATALKTKVTALSRTKAINLTVDMADRIRANREAKTAYAVASGAAAAAPTVNCIQSTTAATDCAPADMAAADLYQWSQQVTSALPGTVTRSITVNTGTDPATYTIVVNWSEPGSGTLSYSLQVQI